ncbi:MAG: DoxX family protein [Chloroflexota bacterium]
MWEITAAISILFAAVLAASAIRKLTHAPGVVTSYRLAGVPEERLNLLAAVLLAAAGGLVVGVALPPLGVLTAGCLVAYFGTAIGFHLRSGDVRHLPSPVAHLAVALAILALHVAR